MIGEAERPITSVYFNIEYTDTRTAQAHRIKHTHNRSTCTRTHPLLSVLTHLLGDGVFEVAALELGQLDVRLSHVRVLEVRPIQSGTVGQMNRQRCVVISCHRTTMTSSEYTIVITLLSYCGMLSVVR